MKDYVIVFVIIVVCLIFFNLNSQKTEEKINSDYEQIEQVKNACEKVADSELIYTLGTHSATWYIFDLEVMYKKRINTNAVHTYLQCL